MADTYNKCDVCESEVSEELLYAARLAVRANRTSAYDKEIKDLILAARAELTEVGVLPAKAYDDTDPLAKRACILYVKAEFGLDNPDAARYRESFDSLKKHLSLSSEYIGG